MVRMRRGFVRTSVRLRCARPAAPRPGHPETADQEGALGVAEWPFVWSVAVDVAVLGQLGHRSRGVWRPSAGRRRGWRRGGRAGAVPRQGWGRRRRVASVPIGAVRAWRCPRRCCRRVRAHRAACSSRRAVVADGAQAGSADQAAVCPCRRGSISQMPASGSCHRASIASAAASAARQPSASR